MNLSKQQTAIHERAMQITKENKTSEWNLIQVLREVEVSRTDKAMGQPSLFSYAMEILKLDEAQAYSLITLARKTSVIPELAKALSEQTLTAAKATRIVGSLTAQNASELIDFAIRHTAREINQEVARRNPQQPKIERVKFISEDQVEITMTICKTTLDEIERIKSLEARNNPKMNIGQAFSTATKVYLHYRDPVVKAERNAHKAATQEAATAESCPVVNRSNSGTDPVSNPELCTPEARVPKRQYLTAAQKHAALYVTKGHCTHVGPSGQACGRDRYIDIHHIVEVARGGSNDASNLTTLCEFHHRMAHRKTKKYELPTFEEWLEMPDHGYTY